MEINYKGGIIMTGDFKIELIPESTKEEVLNPSANLIGEACRGVLHLVLDPLVKLNIIRNKSLKDFEEKINTKNEAIPLENRDDSKIGLALKAVEDSKYQLEDDELREMFSNLISSTLDSRKNSLVQPCFSSILKDLSVQDAQLLLHFKPNTALPLVNIRLVVESGEIGTNVLEYILLTEKHVIHKPTSISSLERLGIITIKTSKLQSQKYMDLYSSFKSDSLYTNYESKLPINTQEFSFTKITLQEHSVELTPLGVDFLNIVS